ncbi:MAG: M64 family metallopeptidase [Clostridium sp.]|nr:M64 family metallopeptidase [Clostridium sp.]
MVEKDLEKYRIRIGNTYCLYVTPEEQDIEIPLALDEETKFEFRDWGDGHCVDWLRGEKDHKPFTYKIHVDENKGDYRAADSGFGGGRLFSIDNRIQINQLKAGIHTTEEQIEALRDFYNATDGENWRYKNNWFSDLPIYKWEGINEDGQSVYDKYMVNSFVTYNWNEEGTGFFPNIRGMLPPSFTVLMDDARKIDLSFNGFTGKFPKEIIQHPRWNEFGWNFISVSTYHGGKIDFSDGINLRTGNFEHWDAVGQKWVNTYDVLAEHDYTLVVSAPCAPWLNPDMKIPLKSEYVNLWLDFAPKGLGIVTTQAYHKDAMGTNIYEEMVEPELLRQVEMLNYPKDIRWFDSFAQSEYPMGSLQLFDKEGNLIWGTSRDYLMPPQYFADEAAQVLKGIYGDPVEHELFEIKNYASSDYSEDGKVIELQKATVGNGIDIVLMGDGFLDLDMDDGGLYQLTMEYAMEYLFLVEPLRSLRDRFNVYAVKVVSPNDFSFNDAVHRLNGDKDLIRQYAEKIENLDYDKAHTCVINNCESLFITGYTWMFPESGSLSVIENGAVSEILIHEVVGHGIGKLLDEYIEYGFENNVFDEEGKETLRQWLKINYHDLGYGMNLSSSPVPEETPWAHMLADKDYSKEVSVVQGAWISPYDLWRPTENSCMRYDYMYFNAPSREAKWVMSRSEGPEWKYDFQEFKKFDKGAAECSSKPKSQASISEKGEKPRRFYKNKSEFPSPTTPLIKGGQIQKF